MSERDSVVLPVAVLRLLAEIVADVAVAATIKAETAILEALEESDSLVDPDEE